MGSNGMAINSSLIMRINDTINLQGLGFIDVNDAVTGKLIKRVSYKNAITDYTREEIFKLFTGGSASLNIGYVGIGTGTTTATAADTALEAEELRLPYTSRIIASPTEIRYKLFLSASQGNGNTYSEIGLFIQDTGGDMVARSTGFTPVEKTSLVTITFTHIIRYQ
jgi:hypothetical protein